MHKNHVHIIGHFGEAKIHEVRTGGEVANIRIRTDEDLDSRIHTEWHGAFTFDDPIIKTIRGLSHGDTVSIKGVLRTRKYEKDGITRYYTEIRIEDLTPQKAA